MGVKNLVNKYKDWFLYRNLEWLLRDCSSVLDLGCGESSPISRIKKHFTSVGVDAYSPSIVKSKKLNIHDRYILCDLLSIDKKIKSKSFDAVILLDVVEHFSKRDGLRLLKQAERVARKKIVVLTPNPYYRQDELGGNPYQLHKSGWKLTDFQNRGYCIRGLRGWKALRREYATIYLKPWLFWALLAFFSEPFLYFWPETSYHFLAVKRLNG